MSNRLDTSNNAIADAVEEVKTGDIDWYRTTLIFKGRFRLGASLAALEG